MNKTFNWFCDNFMPKIREKAEEFWNTETDCRLIAMFDDENMLFRGEEFFVTRIKPTEARKKQNDDDILLKLSKESVQMLLENSLGSNNKTFSLENLTELEAKVLTEFNNVLGKSFMPLILDESAQNNTLKNRYNLLFYLKSENGSIGKLLISIPAKLLAPKEVEVTGYDFDINAYAASTTRVDILAGTSKTTLQDLKLLEKGDIVVLENSKLSKMTLKMDGETKTIRVNPDPALIVNINGHGGNTMSANTKDMWDTIQVEIGAEFEKVKITLGELKQISEGLVVDIGSVYENKIDLKVENKIIASGELVIINDRYGVRIDAIHKNEKTIAEANANSIKPAEQSIDDDTDSSNEDLDSDEFDYSDFDVEDEDI